MHIVILVFFVFLDRIILIIICVCVYGFSLFCSPSLSVHYSQYKPLHIVKGDGLFLIDDVGTHYLDCINNVALGNE